jgi:tetratricopeptide (TPR) repeat protein
MQKSKLLTLLSTFSPKDWKQFLRFVDSPFHGVPEESRRLCYWLLKYAPDFKELSKVEAYSTAFPGTAFDKVQLNHVLSISYKVAEHFLAHQAFAEDTFQTRWYILRALEERNLDKHYQFLLVKTETELSESSYVSPDYHLQAYQIHNLEGNRVTRVSPRQFNQRVQLAMDHLDQFYLLEKLRGACYMLISQAILAMPYQLMFTTEVLKFVGEHPNYINNPCLKAYYLIFQLLSNSNSEPYFEALKTLLAESEDRIPHQELKELYQYAINYCNLQIMKLQEKYVEESLNLYMKAIDLGILLEKGYLSPWHYKNIIKLSLRLRQFNRTEQFILDKTILLPANFREDAYHYNLAELYYYTGKRDQALFHLNKVEFTDIHYNLGAKVIICKIYFEQHDDEPLESLLHAFNTFLRRNKVISEEVRQAYHNFVIILRKILRATKDKKSSIRVEIEQTNPLIEKGWLKEIVGI